MAQLHHVLGADDVHVSRLNPLPPADVRLLQLHRADQLGAVQDLPDVPHFVRVLVAVVDHRHVIRHVELLAGGLQKRSGALTSSLLYPLHRAPEAARTAR